jgi:hypothetical protein
MALFNKGTNILATDWTEGKIHILDLNCKYIRSVNISDFLKMPMVMCVQVKENGDENIFLTDNIADKVFLFNSSFQLIRTIGNNLNVQYISIDSNNLYASQCSDNIVSIFNYNDGQLKSRLQVERPFNSTSDLNYVYIVSGFVGERDEDKRKLNKIEKGNYINIISKLNFKIINKIQLDNWFYPRSIYLSNDENIYTIAHELDNNKVWSKNRYLFQINKENNQIVKKIELIDIEFFSDALYLNNKIIVCGVNKFNWNELRIIEFY